MRREFHVRFWEGLGVGFPRATRLVMVFDRKEDAERVLEVLPKRFGRFGLRLHPDKTRMVRFLPPGPKNPKPESFDFLGFTFYMTQTKRGYWIPRQKTSRKRFTRGLAQMQQWMRRARNAPVAKQATTLGQKLRGHFNYYGIRGNSKAIGRFAYEARRLWKKWLSRRSQRGSLTWEAFNRLLVRHPLPPARLRARWATTSASEPVTRGAGCVNCARPVLRGAGGATPPVYSTRREAAPGRPVGRARAFEAQPR